MNKQLLSRQSNIKLWQPMKTFIPYKMIPNYRVGNPHKQYEKSKGDENWKVTLTSVAVSGTSFGDIK